MRRRVSLAVVAILVILAAAVSTRYLSLRGLRRRASGTQSHSLAKLDSARRAEYRESADTMCFAARIGLPCDPR